MWSTVMANHSYCIFGMMLGEIFRARNGFNLLIAIYCSVFRNSHGGVLIMVERFYPSFFNVLSYLSKNLGKDNEFYILYYHRILDLQQEFEYDRDVVSICPEIFDKQLKFLADNFHIVSFYELVDILQKSESLPSNSLVITFDDVYKDFFETAYPLLTKYGLPSTLFLTTDYIDNIRMSWWDKVAYLINNTKKSTLNINDFGRFHIKDKSKYKIIGVLIKRLKNMDEINKNIVIHNLKSQLDVDIDEKKISTNLFLHWKDIRKMCNNGVELGAHTVTHPILTKIPIERAREEIINSKMKIEKETGESISIFSYPNGRAQDFNDEIIKILVDEGFKAAVTTIYGSNNPKADSFDIFSLKRILPSNSLNISSQIRATHFEKLVNLGSRYL